ncbi:MAG: hypothetical protein A2231_08125 [Candidatus Firestonebacteria bacterium RIFOXYA2_FULL_40_8]|nr:MAG: hypothetical protein A2231_08125 [Candidatus Firestonebacteria bacterium RIFOXYA2_FULL_40_8]
MKKMLFLFLSCISFAFAEGKIQIAVMELVPKDVSVSIASTVTDLIRNDLFNTGKYVVLDRSNLDKVLKEQSFQMTGCTTTDCAVEIGKILNMKQMVVGSIGKIGSTFYLNLRIVDVETGQMITSVSEACGMDSELAALSKYASQKLAGLEVKKEFVNDDPVRSPVSSGGMLGKNAGTTKRKKIEAKTAEDIALRSILIPGRGQIENGQDLKGYAILTGEVLAIGATVYTYLLHEQAVADYTNAVAGSDFNALVKKETDLRNLNTISFWTAVGIWAFGVADPFIFGVQNQQGFSMKQNNDGIQLAYKIKF